MINNSKPARNQNKPAVQATETAVQTAESIVNATMELTTEEFNALVNRLTSEQLEALKLSFEERAKANKNKLEKEILEARKEAITDLNISAIKEMLKAEGTTPEVIKGLPQSLFNQLLLLAITAVQPVETTAKTGKAEKHNDLSHKFMLSIACYSYKKEANVDNFNFQPVQPMEKLTLADFEKHCAKNTFANNTTFPLVINGESVADKASAVKIMAEKMFEWYKASMEAGTKA